MSRSSGSGPTNKYVSIHIMHHLPSRTLLLCHGKCAQHSSYSPYAIEEPHPSKNATYIDLEASTQPDVTLDVAKHMTRIMGRYALIIPKNCPISVYVTQSNIRISFWRGVERLLDNGGVFIGIITPNALQICGHPVVAKHAAKPLPASFEYAKLYRDRFVQRVLKVCSKLEFFEVPEHFFIVPQFRDIAVGFRKVL